VEWLDVATGFFTRGQKSPKLKSAIHSFDFGSQGNFRKVKRRIDHTFAKLKSLTSTASSLSADRGIYMPSIDPTENILGFSTNTVRASRFTTIGEKPSLLVSLNISWIIDPEGRKCGALYKTTPLRFEDDESSMYEFALLSTSPSRRRDAN
jgi:hypothetical protein